MNIIGTTYITAGAFVSRYEHAPEGSTFVYATGDLAKTCQWESDCAALRQITQKYEREKKIVLTQRVRGDLLLKDKGRAFEYLATKCRKGDAA